jgi:hypothetical protein
MLDKIKSILLVIGSILTVVVGFFLTRKNNTGEKVAELEKKVEANNVLVKAEETKREEIVKTLEEEKKKDVSPTEIIDFFSNRPK